MRNYFRYLALATLVMLLVGCFAPTGSARVVQIEEADRAGAKTLAYVEPFKIKRGVPKRLYVEMSDGSAYVFTPCRFEDGRDCFWWASARGNQKGRSFVTLRGHTYYL